MKRTKLRSKDTAELLQQYPIAISKKDLLESYQDDNLNIIVINKIPSFFLYNNIYIPTIKLLLSNPLLPKVTIDTGAIKFIINGADIMRPGITSIDPKTKSNQPVVIIDQQHQKPLAVGIALYSAEEMQQLKSGKVIKNIHYVGDEIWKSTS
ncbi:TPA: RNA-binding protein [Candidatus Woesearchaeota archaeon]|nr:RNA-binding protein [Candidatus Woesearchaeota archaeon]